MRVTLVAAVVMGLALLAGPAASSSPAPPGAAVELTVDQIVDVQSKVRFFLGLGRPVDVRFGRIRAVKMEDGSTLVCGEVDIKLMGMRLYAGAFDEAGGEFEYLGTAREEPDITKLRQGCAEHGIVF